MQQDFLN